MSKLTKAVNEMKEAWYSAWRSVIHSARRSVIYSARRAAIYSASSSSKYKNNKNAEVFLKVLKDE